MIGWISTGLKFLAPYRFWISVGFVVAAVATVAIFYGNCRANAAHLEGAYAEIKDLRGDLQLARIELEIRNEHIADMNEAHRQELMQARNLLNQAVAMAEVIRNERDEIKTELKQTQFELLEAIRDDEEMADWVDWDVPLSAWSLLRTAAEGSELSRTQP